MARNTAHETPSSSSQYALALALAATRIAITGTQPEAASGSCTHPAFKFKLPALAVLVQVLVRSSNTLVRVEVIAIGRILLLGLPGVPVIRRPGPGVQPRQFVSL